KNLDPGQALWHNNTLLAIPVNNPQSFSIELAKKSPAIIYDEPIHLIGQTWHIFQHNAKELRLDFDLITSYRNSAPILDPHTAVYHRDSIFVEAGAKIRAAVLNAENGPIYIGKNAEVQEGALIRGPFALCEGS